jgi:uracil-DNA glycosylase
MSKIQLPDDWKELLSDQFDKEYMVHLREFLIKEAKAGKIIYPKGKDIFNAFNFTPLKNVKVVILGQDPYHGPNQAHGLCFSVNPPTPPPPSLVNIFKELASDVKVAIPNHGNLEAWAKQGVLLLNTVLTVENGKAGSHHQKGWEQFTDTVIERLSRAKKNLVFILWGSPAQKKEALITKNDHLIIKSVHPSPLSSYRGFFGSKPFSKTNEFLKSHQQKTIDWSL